MGKEREKTACIQGAERKTTRLHAAGASLKKQNLFGENYWPRGLP